MLIQAIRNLPDPVHLLKVESTLALLVVSAQILWPSIRQHKLIRAMQTQGCHVPALAETLFMTLSSCKNPNIFRPTYPETPLLANLHGALKAHTRSKHNLGYANPTSGYHPYHQGILPKYGSPIAHRTISNAFWTILNLSFKMEKNILHCRTLFSQKHAVQFQTSTDLQFVRSKHHLLHA